MKVVGIHGILHDYLSAPQIENEWLLALQGGLEVAGKPRIERNEFTCVGYGDFFRPSGTRSGYTPSLSYTDIEEEWEQELLLKWWSSASRVNYDPDVDVNDIGCRVVCGGSAARTL